MLMVAPLDKHFSLLYHILQEHIRDDADYKVRKVVIDFWSVHLVLAVNVICVYRFSFSAQLQW